MTEEPPSPVLIELFYFHRDLVVIPEYLLFDFCVAQLMISKLVLPEFKKMLVCPCLSECRT